VNIRHFWENITLQIHIFFWFSIGITFLNLNLNIDSFSFKGKLTPINCTSILTFAQGKFHTRKHKRHLIHIDAFRYNNILIHKQLVVLTTPPGLVFTSFQSKTFVQYCTRLAGHIYYMSNLTSRPNFLSIEITLVHFVISM